MPYAVGTYHAILIDAGITDGAEGKDPSLFVSFDVSFAPGNIERMTKRLYLHTENAREFTFRVLRTLGFSGGDPSVLAEGMGDWFPVGREVAVVVDEEPGFKDPSKKFHVIKFVNSLAGNGGTGVKRADPARA